MDAPARSRRAHRRARVLPLDAPVPETPARPVGARPLDLPDASVWYLPEWLDQRRADALLADLLTGVAWQTHTLKLFGRSVQAPRRCAWHGDAGARYGYSGLALEPLAWTPALGQLRETLTATVGIRFNAVLANLYRDGHDRMGWHADDEPALGPEPVIASVSLGATRRFLLRHRTRADLPVAALALEHGSLLVMAGATQRCWKHALPAATRVAGVRVNLTFRTVRAPAFADPGRNP